MQKVSRSEIPNLPTDWRAPWSRTILLGLGGKGGTPCCYEYRPCRQTTLLCFSLEVFPSSPSWFSIPIPNGLFVAVIDMSVDLELAQFENEEDEFIPRKRVKLAHQTLSRKQAAKNFLGIISLPDTSESSSPVSDKEINQNPDRRSSVKSAQGTKETRQPEKNEGWSFFTTVFFLLQVHHFLLQYTQRFCSRKLHIVRSSLE